MINKLRPLLRLNKQSKSGLTSVVAQRSVLHNADIKVSHYNSFNSSKAKMKLFSFFALAVAVMAQDYDDLGNKKKGKEEVVDKGPRECKGVKIVDTATTKYKCKSRKADQKNRHLSKRCKVQCGKSKSFTGTKKVYCNPDIGWVLRKKDTPATIGTCN